MKLSYLLLLILLIGCGDPVRERRTTHTGVIGAAEGSKDFIPEFDNVRKSEVFIAIEPEVESEIDPLLKEQGLTQDIIERSEEYTRNMVPINDINLDDGFRLVGHYGEDGCLWKIYKKEYEVTWLYIHVDCNGNRIKIHKDK